MKTTNLKKIKQIYEKSGLGSLKQFSETIDKVAEKELDKKKTTL